MEGGTEIQEELNPRTMKWEKIGSGPRFDPNSFHSIVAPILQKVRDKGSSSLTPQEREAFDMYVRTSPMDQIMRGAFSGGAPGAPPAAPGAPPPTSSNGRPATEDDAISQAKAAIAGGADRAAVERRLRGWGYSPSRLGR
jgi:hypothetical protein